MLGGVFLLPLDKKLQSGCVSTPDSINQIAETFYTGLNDIFKTSDNENYVRVVSGVMTLEEEDVNKVSSTHHIKI